MEFKYIILSKIKLRFFKFLYKKLKHNTYISNSTRVLYQFFPKNSNRSEKQLYLYVEPASHHLIDPQMIVLFKDRTSQA
jgi:hypothetical protein